jgi:hypothetical protein
MGIICKKEEEKTPTRSLVEANFYSSALAA